MSEHLLSRFDAAKMGRKHLLKRARSHIRQFEALNACNEALKALPHSPSLVVQVKEDSLVLGVDFERLIPHIEKNENELQIISPNCAAGDSVNNRIVLACGSVADIYFSSPLLDYHHSLLGQWVHNVGTYYADTFARNGLSLRSSPLIQVVGSNLLHVSSNVLFLLFLSMMLYI